MENRTDYHGNPRNFNKKFDSPIPHRFCQKVDNLLKLIKIQMNKKGFANLMFIIVIIVLAGAAGYFALAKKQSKVSDNLMLQPKNETTDRETYNNNQLGFSFNYPPEWGITVKENDLGFGSLVSIKFITGQTQEVDPDEFLAFAGCFNRGGIDPLYSGDFLTLEPITVSGVATSIYRDQNRGLEILKFYIPFMKRDLDVKFAQTSPPSNISCGVFFQGFTDLTKDKQDIINSIDFAGGFDTFVNKVIEQFETNPPIKG